ncbi:MAG TPA: hypothetical protein VJW93_09635 [Candidatus Acidoferrales bacterium]|nr:hypothetical protein [Candidatus Acidoferrales bacterium]
MRIGWKLYHIRWAAAAMRAGRVLPSAELRAAAAHGGTAAETSLLASDPA